MGVIGRKLNSSEPPAALNMLPKLEEVPMRMYFIVLEKIRRPSRTPPARIPRSLPNRTMSAASLATSLPVSTEIPTSASRSAMASFTPSPRKPTSLLRPRCAVMILDFCSGETLANIPVRGIRSSSSLSLIFSSSGPLIASPKSRPSARQTDAATSALSPVTSLTSIPRALS